MKYLYNAVGDTNIIANIYKEMSSNKSGNMSCFTYSA